MHAVSCCYCRCVVASGAAALKRLNGNALECERLSTTAAGDATSSFQSAWIKRSASNTGRVLRSHRGVSNVCTSVAVRSHVALYAVRIQFYTSTLPISESLYFVRQELPFFPCMRGFITYQATREYRNDASSGQCHVQSLSDHLLVFVYILSATYTYVAWFNLCILRLFCVFLLVSVGLRLIMNRTIAQSLVRQRGTVCRRKSRRHQRPLSR